MERDKLDRVIEGLKVCTNPATKRGCLDGLCPYDGKGCRSAMERDAMELLKEQEQIVRCKDCKYSNIYPIEDVNGKQLYECCHPSVESIVHPFDWFCADAEPKD